MRELKKHTYHGKPLTEKQLGKALKDLDREGQKSGVGDGSAERLVPAMPTGGEGGCECGCSGVRGRLCDPDFVALLEGDGYLAKFEKGLMSTRRAYGLALM